MSGDRDTTGGGSGASEGGLGAGSGASGVGLGASGAGSGSSGVGSGSSGGGPGAAPSGASASSAAPSLTDAPSPSEAAAFGSPSEAAAFGSPSEAAAFGSPSEAAAFGAPNLLVVDAGSASLKLTVLDGAGRELASKHLTEPPGPGTADDLAAFLKDAPAVGATGHRVVHGGPRLLRATVVDDDVRAELDRAADLAPLHVPPALAALDAARRQLPGVPHVACFDTAFHADLPPAAHTYALPRGWTERYGLRRYGFHGLSYAWALARTAAVLDRPADTLHVVLAHLGGGCSATAVRDGRSVDTTMGFTPLEGLVMSKRSGSVDPGLLLWLQTSAGLTADQLEEALNHRSGLLGLSGSSGDTRDLVRAASRGERDAAGALDVFTLSVRRGIAGVAASLDRIDALVFTGEIGEDQPEVREAVCAGLGVLGVTGALTAENPTAAAVVSPRAAAVPVLVVPTGETQQVAAETRAALAGAAA